MLKIQFTLHLLGGVGIAPPLQSLSGQIYILQILKVFEDRLAVITNDPHLIRLHKAFRDPIDLHQQLPRRT